MIPNDFFLFQAGSPIARFPPQSAHCLISKYMRSLTSYPEHGSIWSSCYTTTWTTLPPLLPLYFLTKLRILCEWYGSGMGSRIFYCLPGPPETSLSLYGWDRQNHATLVQTPDITEASGVPGVPLLASLLPPPRSWYLLVLALICLPRCLFPLPTSTVPVL